VPEAAVDEDRETRLSESEVDSDRARSSWDDNVLAITDTERGQCSTKRKLWSGTGRTI